RERRQKRVMFLWFKGTMRVCQLCLLSYEGAPGERYLCHKKRESDVVSFGQYICHERAQLIVLRNGSITPPTQAPPLGLDICCSPIFFPFWLHSLRSAPFRRRHVRSKPPPGQRLSIA